MDEFGKRGLKVVSIHSTFHKVEDLGLADLKAFVAANKIAFPVALDARKDGDDQTSTLLRYKADDVPLMVLVDKKGIVRFTGDWRSDEKQMEANIDQMLKE